MSGYWTVAVAGEGWSSTLHTSSRYVFPDGELTPIIMTLATAEATGFEVRDVESLKRFLETLPLVC